MLKLSLAVTLFTSVAGSILTEIPPTPKTEKFSANLQTIDTINQKITSQQLDQITALIQFIRNRRNINNGIQTPTPSTPTPIIEIET